MCAQPLRANTAICCESKAVQESPKQCSEVCLDLNDPVCGSNGVTYPNKCLCEWAACKNPSANITCETKGTCRDLQCFSPNCPSVLLCNLFINPICGSDGHTYINQCFFDNARCCKGGLLFGHWGECYRRWVRRWGHSGGVDSEEGGEGEECDQIECDGSDKQKKCGSDGVTYPNECELNRAACKDPSKEIVCIANGPCKRGQQSLCPDNCPKIIAPVCGTDNVTYVNSCFLDLNTCRFPELGVTLKGTGPCKPETSNLGLELMLGGLIGNSDDAPDVSAREAAALIDDVAWRHVKRQCYDNRGRKCIFPFVYKRKTYVRCTRDYFRYPWCATEVNRRGVVVEGSRGRCGIGCDN